jgi:TctA family transporter
MPLLTGLFSKSLLIRQIRERAKRHGFYEMR